MRANKPGVWAHERHLPHPIEGPAQSDPPATCLIGPLSFKGVFGAVGGYIDGKIFISCGNFGIALRLPPVALQDVFEADDVQTLRYFPKGHIKRGYAVIPRRILEDRALLVQLMGESVSYARGTWSP